MNQQTAQENNRTTTLRKGASQRTSSTQKGTVRGKTKTKKQIAISLLKRAQGASLKDLEKQLDWQPHSIRGLISGTLRKLEGFDLITKKSKSGQLRYRLIAKEGI